MLAGTCFSFCVWLLSLVPPINKQQLEMTARVRQAQYQALRLVNRQQLDLYWELGCLIIERQ